MNLFKAKQTQVRDYTVKYPDLFTFRDLWLVTLNHRDFGPKFYVHTDGTVWVSYVSSEVYSCSGGVSIPHSCHKHIEVYDFKRTELAVNGCVHRIDSEVSNTPAYKSYAIPKPVFYFSNCGILSRDRFVEALELKLNLVKVNNEHAL